MATIALGQGPDGVAKIDLDVLLRTRLLIQANSGGGKSWLVRKTTGGFIVAEELAL